MNNNRGLAILTGTFLALGGICAIVNYSIDRTLTWAWFPIGGLVVVWAIFAPLLLLKQHRAWGVWAGLAITLIPFLYLVQYLTGGTEWFKGLALPIAGLFLSALALCIIGFRVFRQDPLFATAFCILIFGVALNYGVGQIVNSYLHEQNGADVYRYDSIRGSVIVAVVLIVKGFFDRRKVKG